MNSTPTSVCVIVTSPASAADFLLELERLEGHTMPVTIVVLDQQATSDSMKITAMPNESNAIVMGQAEQSIIELALLAESDRLGLKP